MTWNCIKLWRYVSIEGQGHFLILTQSQLHMKLKTGFSQKSLGQSKPNFICKLSGSRKWKFFDMMLVTWPKWLPRPYMEKPFKNLPLWIRWTDFHKTWYVALMTPAYHNLFKWWPWVDPLPILWQGQICELRLFYRKNWKLLIFQNCWSLWPEIYWDKEHMWVLKVKVISWPWPKVILHLKTKTGFSQKPLGQSKLNFICKLSGSRKW